MEPLTPSLFCSSFKDCFIKNFLDQLLSEKIVGNDELQYKCGLYRIGRHQNYQRL